MKSLNQNKKNMNRKKIKGLAVAGIILLLTAMACQTTKPLKVKDIVIKGTNMHEVANPSVRVAYIDPYVDYDQYKKILVHPLNFDTIEIIQPPNTPRNIKFELTEEDRETLNKIYQEMMLEYLEKKGDFKVVQNPGPDVLALSVYVMRLRPNAPKDDLTSRGFGQTKIFTEGAGSMTIAASAFDSTSGKELARIADSKSGSQMWGINNRVTNTRDVSLMFGEWAKKFNAALKNLHDYEIKK